LRRTTSSIASIPASFSFGPNLGDFDIAGDVKLPKIDGFDSGIGWRRLAAICVHQPTVPYLHAIADELNLPTDRLVPIVARYGNLAAASLPFQLATAIEQGRCGPGEGLALLGLASGVSVGAILVRL
jgi:3-oxoacyl-[acyl-carrier-protein] synthase-3